MSPQSYSNIIGGQVPVHSQGLSDETATMAAQEALGSDQVHIITSEEDNGRVFYLAVPSKDLSSAQDPSTPIAAALPGHPDHMGEGVYVLTIFPYKIAAVFEDHNIKIIYNDAALIDDYVSDLNLPVFIADNFQGWRFESSFTKAKSLSASINKFAFKYSTITTIVSCLAAVTFSISAGGLAKISKQSSASIEESLQLIIKDIRTSSHLNEIVSRLQSKTSTVVRAGGWVDYYSVKDGKESFRFYMPSWISRDYITALGDDVRNDLTQQSETLIQVIKGKPIPEQIEKKDEKAAQNDQQQKSPDKK